MSSCDVCGKNENMPYQCHHCGGTFCAEHRLPRGARLSRPGQLGRPGRGVRQRIRRERREQRWVRGLADRLSLNTGPGGLLGYFRGNMTYVFLGLMWVTFLAQHVAIALGGLDLHQTLFVLRPQYPQYVWTWISSIFAHSPFGFMHRGELHHHLLLRSDRRGLPRFEEVRRVLPRLGDHRRPRPDGACLRRCAGPRGGHPRSGRTGRQRCRTRYHGLSQRHQPEPACLPLVPHSSPDLGDHDLLLRDERGGYHRLRGDAGRRKRRPHGTPRRIARWSRIRNADEGPAASAPATPVRWRWGGRGPGGPGGPGRGRF